MSILVFQTVEHHSTADLNTGWWPYWTGGCCGHHMGGSWCWCAGCSVGGSGELYTSSQILLATSRRAVPRVSNPRDPCLQPPAKCGPSSWYLACTELAMKFWLSPPGLDAGIHGGHSVLSRTVLFDLFLRTGGRQGRVPLLRVSPSLCNRASIPTVASVLIPQDSLPSLPTDCQVVNTRGVHSDWGLRGPGLSCHGRHCPFLSWHKPYIILVFSCTTCIIEQ